MLLCALICVLSYVLSCVCSYVLSYLCPHMCAPMCSHMCALISVLPDQCSHMCGLLCVLLCALIPVLSYVCSYVLSYGSHMCAPRCTHNHNLMILCPFPNSTHHAAWGLLPGYFLLRFLACIPGLCPCSSRSTIEKSPFTCIANKQVTR